MDIVDVIVKLVTAFGVFFAGVGLYLNWRARAQDLRWRMASAARDAVTDLHKNAYAVEAVRMIDCVRFKEQYDAPPSLSDVKGVEWHMILKALDRDARRTVDTNLPEGHRVYIRRCFDWLLYYMDRVAYQTKVGFLLHDDFDAPLAPYAKFIKKHFNYFEKLVNEQNYRSLPSQLERLEKAFPEDGPPESSRASP